MHGTRDLDDGQYSSSCALLPWALDCGQLTKLPFRANQASGPEKPEFALGRIGGVLQDPYQPKRVRAVPEVLPDSLRHSSVDRSWCVSPGDVRGAVWLAVYRVCSNLDVALVHDPVPQGNIGTDRPAK
jgi:hypothetical protein